MTFGMAEPGDLESIAADQGRAIAKLENRIKKLEDVAACAQPFACCEDPFMDIPIRFCGECKGCRLVIALHKLEHP